MNKKQYIVPAMMEHQPKCGKFLTEPQALSNTGRYSGAGQSGEGLSKMGIDVDGIGYDNSGLGAGDAAGANGRGGFGSDSGPWESLW